MKRSLIVGALTLAALSQTLSPTFAADLPPAAPVYRAPAVYVPPVHFYDWTGFYIGINGGYGFNQATGNTFCFGPGGVPSAAGCDIGTTNAVKPAGAVAGGQMGWNGQANWFVYGIETDLQWAGIKQTATVADTCCVGGAAAAGTYTANAEIDWFGTTRLRIGAAADRVLFYATGGAIYGGVKIGNTTVLPLGAGLAAGTYTSTSNAVRVGWTAGAGIEGALTENLTARIEGLYYDMGTQASQFQPAGAPVFAMGGTEKFTGVIARAGLNWKFH
jgi:outer membrane immunogenic protein